MNNVPSFTASTNFSILKKVPRNTPSSSKSRFPDPRVLLAAALLSCALPAAAAGPLVVQSFSSERPDPELEDVLYLALGVELYNAGYSSSRGGKDASHLLSVDYQSKGAEAEVRLSLSRAETPGDVLASVEFTLHIDSSFDLDLGSAMRKLLEFPAASPPQGGQSSPEIAGLFPSGLVSREALLRTDRTLRIETAASGGGAPFFGDFSDYAGYGAYGSAQAGVLFLRRSWSLSLGGRFSLTRAFMADGVDGGPVYLSTAGINLQYGLGAEQKIKLAVCASGGAAVITLPEAGLSKTVPYADGGVQAGFPVAKDLFLGGDLRLLAVFDPDLLILGAAVSVSVSKEF